ncbi:hypothetical protein LguiA_015259 [Lonicera macranthoides]
MKSSSHVLRYRVEDSAEEDNVESSETERRVRVEEVMNLVEIEEDLFYQTSELGGELNKSDEELLQSQGRDLNLGDDELVDDTELEEYVTETDEMTDGEPITEVQGLFEGAGASPTTDKTHVHRHLISSKAHQNQRVLPCFHLCHTKFKHVQK